MSAPPASQGRPRLLQQLRHALRVHHYSRRTEDAYVGGEHEIRDFLTALAVRGRVSASTQTQALSALVFRYREVLQQDPGSFGDLVRARQPTRLPVVLTREEVSWLLEQLEGVPRVVCILLYGSGLRLLEALELRVKDLDFAGGEIRVRRPRGRRIG